MLILEINIISKFSKLTDLPFILSIENLDHPKLPKREDYQFVGLDDILATLSVKEREEYYALETKCAVIGKFMYPDGSYSKARKELQQKIVLPVTVATVFFDILKLFLICYV